MIPDENVERVREAADIVSVIGEYVQLKRSGNSFRGNICRTSTPAGLCHHK